MKNYQAILEELKDAPQLPVLLAELNQYLEEEKKSRQQYFDDMDEDSKDEFINGEIVIHSPARDRHTEVVGYVKDLLSMFVRKNQLGKLRAEQAAIQCSRNIFVPDLAFWGTEKASKIDATTLVYSSPDWVCEVLSKSTAKRDRGIKLNSYQDAGISEYWILDADNDLLEQYLLVDDKYEIAIKTGSGFCTSQVLGGLSFPIPALFDGEANFNVITSILSK